MSRRFIQLLIVVVTITLIGLIYIQMLWIRNATSIKEDHFDQLVRQALDQVVHRLELNETSYFGAQLDLDPGLSLPPQLRNENRYFSGKNQFREDKNRMKYDISLDFSLTGTHLSTRFYQSDSLVTVTRSGRLWSTTHKAKQILYRTPSTIFSRNCAQKLPNRKPA